MNLRPLKGNIMRRIIIALALALGLVSVPSTAHAVVSDLSYRLDYEFVNGVEWRVYNPDTVDHQYYLVYNDEQNRTWSTAVFTAPAGEAHEVASTTYVTGNGVVLKATLYTADGKRVETERITESR